MVDTWYRRLTPLEIDVGREREERGRGGETRGRIEGRRCATPGETYGAPAVADGESRDEDDTGDGESETRLLNEEGEMIYSFMTDDSLGSV